MLDKTDDSSVAADNWLSQFEEALAKPDDGALNALFHPDSYWRDVLALSWNIQTLNGADAILKALPPLARNMAPSGFAIDPDRAAPRKVMRAGTNAIEAIFKFETKVGRGSGIIRLDSGCGRWQPPQGLDAADRAWRTQRFRGTTRRPAPARQRLFARFSRTQLARPAQAIRRLCRPRSDRSRHRRRTIRALHRRAAEAVERRYPDRRSRTAHRRQLAQALPCADAAQPSAGQPPALHALPAELADLHPQGQARQLVRSLCRGHGAELLDRDRIRGRQLRREGKAAGP